MENVRGLHPPRGPNLVVTANSTIKIDTTLLMKQKIILLLIFGNKRFYNYYSVCNDVIIIQFLYIYRYFK